MTNNLTPKSDRRANCGRKKIEGARHTYTVADDVHEWIMKNGAGDYLNKTIRVIMAMNRQNNGEEA